MKQQCENSDTCRDLFGVEMMSCVRQCMSADCYKELYAEDEVRLQLSLVIFIGIVLYGNAVQCACHEDMLVINQLLCHIGR